MPTLPNMSLITPTLGADSGTWDDKINAAFALVDAHDHTSGKGVLIATAAIGINADLSMAGYGLTSLSKLTFSTISAPSTGSKNLYVSSADNELYWRTNSGTNVKLTNGASINTTLVGGIVGDYSSVGAEIAFEDADQQYTLKTQTDKWARLKTGPVRIHEYNTADVVYVEHAAAAALASSYTVTWPAALPASTQPMQISSSGAVTFGTQDKILALAGAAWQSNSGTYNRTYGLAIAEISGATTYVLPIPLHTGDTIKSITLAAWGNVSADADIAVFNVVRVTSAGVTTELGTTSSSNVPNTWTDITIDVTDTTLGSGDVVFAGIQVNGAGATGLSLGNTRITYTPGN